MTQQLNRSGEGGGKWWEHQYLTSASLATSGQKALGPYDFYSFLDTSWCLCPRHTEQRKISCSCLGKMAAFLRAINSTWVVCSLLPVMCFSFPFLTHLSSKLVAVEYYSSTIHLTVHHNFQRENLISRNIKVNPCNSDFPSARRRTRRCWKSCPEESFRKVAQGQHLRKMALTLALYISSWISRL